MTMSDRIAVMHQGRIEQLGPPEELYERPRTAFVAGFLGVSNLLDGELVGGGDGFVDVRVADGTVLRAPGDGAPGAGSVRIGVRPEKLRVTAADETTTTSDGPALNVLDGRVLDASYVGVSTQYLVEMRDGQRLVVYAQNLETSGAAGALADGQGVRLTWKPQHTFVLDTRPAHDHAGPPEEDGHDPA